LEKAYACLEKELSEIINKMKEEQEKITNTIIEDIKKQAEEKIKSYYQSQNLPLDEIQVRIEQTIVLFSEIVALSLTAIAKVLGISVGVVIGAGILIGACSSLVIGAGIIIGFGLIGGLALGGIIIAVGFLFVKYKKINQYREILEKAKSQLISKFQDIEYSFSEHYKTFKDTLINELKLKTQVYLKRINNDDSEWKEIQEKYEEIKKNTLKKVKEKFNFSIN
jgi:gas vesicle protein